MRKNIYLYGFLIVVCLFNLLKSIGQPNQTEFDNYITISNGQFWDGNSHFYPVCVNYLVEYLSDRSDPYSPVYYISPLLSYSNIKRYHYDTFRHGFPVDTSEHWGYGMCVQNILLNSWANIYHYDSQHPNSPWQYVWTNMGNGQIGNWNYAPGDVILSGHFNDSTYCSIICIRNQGHLKNALCQRLYSSSWTTYWTSTSLPNETYIGSWILGNQDKYYVGDFSGDGIDELLCVQATNGTSDKMTLMQYNASWSTLWSNNGISEGVDICPYRANLHVGNFDSDRADELLGINSWATKFDLNSSNQWNWSWSTYESGKLSDWAVNLEHHAFFMKTVTDVPDYLFVFRGNPRIDFKFDGYSFDP